MEREATASDDEVGRLDAAYRPIPQFADWPRDVPEGRWQAAAERLKERQTRASDAVIASAAGIAIRAAAMDTGAIEGLYSTDRGLTLTFATQAAAWEAEVQRKSPEAAPFLAAQLAAYDMVLDVVTSHRPLTEALIRQFHEKLTGPQATYEVQTPAGRQLQPLPRGRYKRYPNHVRRADGDFHAYAPVDSTPVEMARLLAELTSPEFESAHPVLQASYAHYAFIRIHPFADGNGRVARALASIYTYRATSTPLVIFLDNRTAYFSSLEAADAGRAGEFIDFVADASADSMEIFDEGLKTVEAGDPTETMRRLSSMTQGAGGLGHRALDRAATDLAAYLANGALTAKFQELNPPKGAKAKSRLTGSGGAEPPESYRLVRGQNNSSIVTNFQLPDPIDAAAKDTLDIFVATPASAAPTLCICSRGFKDQVILPLSGDSAELTVGAGHKLDLFLKRVLSHVTSELSAKAEESLRRHGYH